MLLNDFNQLSADHKKGLLLQCVHIPRWGEDISQHEPFTSIEALLDFAKQQARSWQWEEILAALNTHPRIGEKQAKQQLSVKEQAFSSREQAKITLDEEIQEALYKGNVAYEKKFGFIFLIRAAGLSSEDILTALKYRLVNEPELEKRIVHQQLSEIALLRLSQELEA